MFKSCFRLLQEYTTLETALLNIPEVVCYRGSKISYAIAKRLVRNIKYISLVNLIMDRKW
ncbi:hypothetical protein [Chryseobacterium indoltheticum]|uniref:hypothetical protein n=1 Tax=Chryseobacterium indoltheticum TaxID=254 RepID=UPI003F499598